MMRMVLCCLLLTGCVGDALQSNAPAPTYYVIRPAHYGNIATNNTPKIIKVSDPALASGLDTQRIAIIKNARQLKYLAAAQYADALGEVLTHFMVDSLNSYPHITAVEEADYSLTPNYRLLTNVTAMQAHYDGSATTSLPTAHIGLRLWLIDMQDGAIIAEHVVNNKTALQENTAGAIIAQFETIWRDAVAALMEKL